MTTKYDLIIIGDGLAARCFLYELAKKSPSLNILQVFSEDKAPACSFKTTSHICLNGVQLGVSKLGDLLFESYKITENIFKTENPNGVYEGEQFSLCKDGEFGRSEFIRRYKKVDKFDTFTNNIDVSNLENWGLFYHKYVIDAEAFMAWLKNQYESKLKIDIKKAFVTSQILSADSVEVVTSEQTYTTSKLLVCAGAYSKMFEEELDFEPLTKSKVVPGQYITFEDVDWGSENFAISKKKYTVCYRAYNNTLMIGGTSLNADDDISDITPLEFEYEQIQKILGDAKILPAFEKGIIRHGLRHKGWQRKPFWGLIKESESAKVYGMFGLYKNGFTFPFLGAKKLVEQMKLYKLGSFLTLFFYRALISSSTCFPFISLVVIVDF